MSQNGILTSDWSIVAIPSYSLAWIIAFGVNGGTHKIRVFHKIKCWNEFISQICFNNDILQPWLQKNFIKFVKNNWKKTNFPALHWHSMKSFTPEHGSECVKFNNRDRQNWQHIAPEKIQTWSHKAIQMSKWHHSYTP